MRVKALILVAAALCLFAAPRAVVAGTDPVPKSSELVKQLVAAMTARQLDVVAAVDPEDAGRIIAAMSFPGVQFLVTSAQHKNADYLAQQIAKKQFREVYDVLQYGLPASRLFFHDIGCDGFVPGEYVDIFYEGAKQRTMFDGNWLAQSLTEEQYAAKRREAEEKYVRALTVLLESVKKLPIIT